MASGVSVELMLDSASEHVVRTEWDALAALGVSSMAAHRDESNRPHVSVAAGTTEERAHALTGAAVAVPIAVVIGAPILFGTGPRRVLARSVVPSAELLALHAAVHDQLGPGDDLMLQQGRWTPHVTLARRIQLESLARALEVVGEHIEARVVGIRLWNADTRTVMDLVNE